MARNDKLKTEAARAALVAWRMPWIEEVLSLCYAGRVVPGTAVPRPSNIPFVMRRQGFDEDTIRYAISVLMSRRFVQVPADANTAVTGFASQYTISERGIAALFAFTVKQARLPAAA